MELPSIVGITFKTTYTPDPQKPGEFKEVDWVTYSPRHAAMLNSTTVRVKELIPPAAKKGDDDGMKMAAMRHRWSMIEPHYTAWKEGLEMPETGTPLAAWPGVNADQAEVLKANGIRTIEEVAAISDTQIPRIPLPGVRELAKNAKHFLESADRNANSKRLTDLEANNAALKEQLDAAMALLEEATRKKQKPEAA